MKKILSILFLLTLVFANAQQAQAIKYDEAINQSKPMALFIYASWADDVDKMKQAFDTMESKYNKTYNFISMDIASSDTKEFNKKYPIYANLPYVLLFKDRGKISRYLQKNCVLDSSCFAEKLNFFAN